MAAIMRLPSQAARLAQRLYETMVPQRVRTGLHNRSFLRNQERWQRIKGTPDSVVAAIEPGLPMRLYGDSLLCEMILLQEFELETRNFLRAFLKPGDVFLDVGANVGLFTLSAARLVGRKGRIHAFEPASQAYARLLENVALNRLKCVTSHQIALSDTNGEAQLTLAANGFDAWNSLGTPYMGEALGAEKVATATLDSFAAAHELIGRITAMKIDVEGWELHVLAGATNLLSRADAPALCVEFTEEAAQLAGSSCEKLYRALEALGYNLFTLGARTGDIVPFPLPERFPNVNLLAIKNLETARRRLSAA